MAKITIEIPDYLIPSFFTKVDEPPVYLSNGKIVEVPIDSLFIVLFSGDTERSPSKKDPYPDVNMKILGANLYKHDSLEALYGGGVNADRIFIDKETLIKSL